MVRLLLSVKADLENVTDLIPQSEDFEFFFQVQCSSCHEVHPKMVSLNRVEEHDLSGSRGNAHFVWRCAMCKRESSAKFDTSYKLKPYPSSADGKFAPLLVIECRGLEFVGFDPRGLWKCKGQESGTPFTDIELEEREWTDYDEKASLPVGIMDLQSEWKRA